MRAFRSSWKIVLAVLVIAGPLVVAQERPDVADEVAQKVVARLGQAITPKTPDQAERLHNPLGQTLKLTFRIEPADQNMHALTVLTATEVYAIQIKVGSDARQERFGIGIAGTLTPRKEGGFLLTFESSLTFGGANETGEVRGTGSAQIAIGETKPLLQVAGKTLSVALEKVE